MCGKRGVFAHLAQIHYTAFRGRFKGAWLYFLNEVPSPRRRCVLTGLYVYITYNKTNA